MEGFPAMLAPVSLEMQHLTKPASSNVQRPHTDQQPTGQTGPVNNWLKGSLSLRELVGVAHASVLQLSQQKMANANTTNGASTDSSD